MQNRSSNTIFNCGITCVQFVFYTLFTIVLASINIVCVLLIDETYSKIVISIINFIFILILMLLYKCDHYIKKRQQRVQPYIVTNIPVIESITIKIENEDESSIVNSQLF